MAEKKKKQVKEKPLEKLTIKELREEALKIEGIVGVHGMNKSELLDILREQRGLEAPKKKNKINVRELKKKVSELKDLRNKERAEGADKKRLDGLRKKISRLKKKTRLK
jgi:hypothetical protein